VDIVLLGIGNTFEVLTHWLKNIVVDSTVHVATCKKVVKGVSRQEGIADQTELRNSSSAIYSI
jgi:hypothetical protein